jgi:hypothetical protein
MSAVGAAGLGLVGVVVAAGAVRAVGHGRGRVGRCMLHVVYRTERIDGGWLARIHRGRDQFERGRHC